MMRRFFPSTIREAGGGVLPFVFQINTNNTSTGSSTSTQFKLPLVSTGTYDFTVDWGDSNIDTGITLWNASETTHTYASAGNYTITITGTLTGWQFAFSGDRLKILDISQWGIVSFLPNTNQNNGVFFGCSNLNVTATDTPIILGGMAGFFRSCFSLVGNSSFADWDVSASNSFAFTFRQCGSFNQPIGSWNVGNSISFFSTFYLANTFNQNIGSWNVGNALAMNDMFRSATAFNNGGSDSINNWNVGLVTQFELMFESATNFNQPIGSWNVDSGVSFNRMFIAASTFNQNIGSWNVGNATNMTSMFQGATNFNQNIGSWNVGNATNMTSMFQGATNFNQNIGSWNVAKVSNFTNFMNGKTAGNYSAVNLDAIYNGWSGLTFVNTGLNINFNTIKYTAAGQAGRDILTGAPNNWSITDGGI